MRLLLFLLLPGALFAQWSADWAYGFGLDIYHVDTDPLGYVFATGAFSGKTDFDPSADTFWLQGNPAPPSTFLARFEPDGSFDWAIPNPLRAGDSQPNTLPDCSAAPDGSVFVASCAFTVTPGFEVARLLKYASDGLPIWQIDLKGTYSAGIHKVLACPDGGAVILATFRGVIDVDPSPVEKILTEAGADNLFIARYSDAGALLWVKQFEQVREGTGLVMDATGHIWLTANFHGSARLDPDGQNLALTSGGSSDAFVARLTNKGDIETIVQLTGPSTISTQGLALDHTGAALITGRYNGSFVTVPAQSGTALPVSNGIYDVFLLKVDSTGQPLWAKQFTGPGIEEGTAVTGSPDGSVFVAGAFSETTDFNPVPGAHVFRTSAGVYDQFIAHFAPDGTFLSVFTTGGAGSDRSFDLAATQEHLYFSGSIHSTVSYTPGSAVGLVANTVNNNLGVLVRFPLRPTFLTTHPGPQKNPDGVLILSPNPALPGSTIHYANSSQLPQVASVEFWEVHANRLARSVLLPQQAISAPEQPGLYLVRLLDGAGRFLSGGKLIVLAH